MPGPNRSSSRMPSPGVEGDDYYAANPTPAMKRDMQRREAEAKKKADEQRAKADKLLGNTSSKGYAKGGSASSRADGCAMRGKTKGKMV